LFCFDKRCQSNDFAELSASVLFLSRTSLVGAAAPNVFFRFRRRRESRLPLPGGGLKFRNRSGKTGRLP
jgi:hypothetical protein